MNCPVCDSTGTKLKFVKNGYEILSCQACNHLFTGIKPTTETAKQIYSDDYFLGGGAGYNDYTQEKEILIKRGEYYAEKIKKFIKPGKVLDVGAAAGFILKGFENKGWAGLGIEPNHSMAAYGVSKTGVAIKEGTIETVVLDETFDLALMIQVAAHVYDLHITVNKIYEALNPGGYLLIETWDKDSYTARLFGKNWHEYSPPSTLNYFSKKTLEKLMTAHGFIKIKERTPKKSIESGHAKSLLKHKLSESTYMKWMTKMISLIPDNIILPYPSEDLFWALYKKNN